MPPIVLGRADLFFSYVSFLLRPGATISKQWRRETLLNGRAAEYRFRNRMPCKISPSATGCFS